MTNRVFKLGEVANGDALYHLCADIDIEGFHKNTDCAESSQCIMPGLYEGEYCDIDESLTIVQKHAIYGINEE